MTIHVLLVPGGRPIEFDAGDALGECGACEARPVEGRVEHDAECRAARAIVARSVADVTTDGSADFVAAARQEHAEQFADEELAHGSTRDALVRAHVAGQLLGEGAVAKVARVGILRMRDEVGALAQRIDQLEAELAALTGSA